MFFSKCFCIFFLGFAKEKNENGFWVCQNNKANRKTVSKKTKQHKQTKGSEYATIVFKAGPPYEDIAFKIVNNEIEDQYRRGFRCRFEKGIFSLYFNFRRYRYRR